MSYILVDQNGTQNGTQNAIKKPDVLCILNAFKGIKLMRVGKKYCTLPRPRAGAWVAFVYVQ